MNNTRRKQIRAIQNTLETCMYELRDLLAEEEEYRDAIPENLQGSDRYTRADEVVDLLTEAADSIESANGQLDEAVEG